jgi:integrase
VKARRTYLDSAAQIVALLDAAGALDRERDGRTQPFRRALLAVLVFGGCRIGEALALEWRDVDLAGGRLKIRGTKTDAAARTVGLLPALRDEHAASRRESVPTRSCSRPRRVARSARATSAGECWRPPSSWPMTGSPSAAPSRCPP